MSNKFTFDQLPDDIGSSLEKGQHKLTIIKAEEIFATTGTLMLQLTHKVDDTDSELRYDNYAILKGDGQTPINFGLAKLKKLLEAINLKFAGSFELEKLPKMLATMVVGKSFLVDLDYDKKDEEKKYLKIIDINSYKPFYPGVDQTKPTKQTPADTISKLEEVNPFNNIDAKFDSSDEEDI